MKNNKKKVFAYRLKFGDNNFLFFNSFVNFAMINYKYYGKFAN